MVHQTEYGYAGMPLLADVLAGISKGPGRIRVHIRSGAPRYYYGRRQTRRVHGNVRYQDGHEAFRSKSITDEVLAMRVARMSVREGGDAAYVYVFSPYGHRKERELSRDPATGAEHWTVVRASGIADALSAYGDMDELPF